MSSRLVISFLNPRHLRHTTIAARKRNGAKGSYTSRQALAHHRNKTQPFISLCIQCKGNRSKNLCAAGGLYLSINKRAA